MIHVFHSHKTSMNNKNHDILIKLANAHHKVFQPETTSCKKRPLDALYSVVSISIFLVVPCQKFEASANSDDTRISFASFAQAFSINSDPEDMERLLFIFTILHAHLTESQLYPDCICPISTVSNTYSDLKRVDHQSTMRFSKHRTK